MALRKEKEAERRFKNVRERGFVTQELRNNFRGKI
jgi:hypothetical protein